MKDRILWLLGALICIITLAVILLCGTGCSKKSPTAPTSRIQANAVLDGYPYNKMLVIGNSLTLHPPKPEISWYGNWGMAATSQENDFVHKLHAKLQADQVGTIELEFTNDGVGWEHEFWYKGIDEFK